MNFLAHAFLSFDHPQILVGNFMADFIKGSNHLQYPDQISKGILLHREIDHFTDRHPEVRSSKRRLQPKYHHYAGVIVDMYYDHFLAANFIRYHKNPLEVFAPYVYNTVGEYQDILPAKVNRILQYMSSGNWLLGYASISGIEQALAGIAHRTRFKSNMEAAGQDLRVNYQKFHYEFVAFFPQVIKFAKDKINQL